MRVFGQIRIQIFERQQTGPSDVQVSALLLALAKYGFPPDRRPSGMTHIHATPEFPRSETAWIAS